MSDNTKDDQALLLARSERCVCKHCGGKLTTSLVIYDIYGGVGLELYCPHCAQNDFGIEPEIYALAQYFAENFQFNYFIDMEENDWNQQLNISKVADIMSWLLKTLGLLDQSGLKDQLPHYDLSKKQHG